jgi:hypothetical protein
MGIAKVELLPRNIEQVLDMDTLRRPGRRVVYISQDVHIRSIARSAERTS